MIKYPNDVAEIRKKAILDILEALKPYEALEEWHNHLYESRQIDSLMQIKQWCDDLLEQEKIYTVSKDELNKLIKWQILTHEIEKAFNLSRS